MRNFTAAHISQCKGPFTICHYCGINEHMEILCNQEKRDNRPREGISRNYGKMQQCRNRSKFANCVKLVDQDEEDEELRC